MSPPSPAPPSLTYSCLLLFIFYHPRHRYYFNFFIYFSFYLKFNFSLYSSSLRHGFLRLWCKFNSSYHQFIRFKCIINNLLLNKAYFNLNNDDINYHHTPVPFFSQIKMVYRLLLLIIFSRCLCVITACEYKFLKFYYYFGTKVFIKISRRGFFFTNIPKISIKCEK